MIEIEKKFILTKKEKDNLLTGAKFLDKKIFTDVYFDTPDCRLTTRDIWLRFRDDRFELKVPLNLKGVERISDQYRELETDEEIIDFLKLNTDDASLETCLLNSGYSPFCKITTIREKYKKDKYNIDLDLMDFGYIITEIELMVSSESEIQEATNSILNFAKENGISLNNVRGKVAEFLYRNNLTHFNALISAGVIC